MSHKVVGTFWRLAGESLPNPASVLYDPAVTSTSTFIQPETPSVPRKPANPRDDINAAAYSIWSALHEEALAQGAASENQGRPGHVFTGVLRPKLRSLWPALTATGVSNLQTDVTTQLRRHGNVLTLKAGAGNRPGKHWVADEFTHAGAPQGVTPVPGALRDPFRALAQAQAQADALPGDAATPQAAVQAATPAPAPVPSDAPPVEPVAAPEPKEQATANTAALRRAVLQRAVNEFTDSIAAEADRLRTENELLRVAFEEVLKALEDAADRVRSALDL